MFFFAFILFIYLFIFIFMFSFRNLYPMAPKDSIQHKGQKEKEKRQREQQEAQDILKSGRFVITQEREDLVVELARGTMGAKGPNFAAVANRLINQLEWPFPYGWLRHQVMNIVIAKICPILFTCMRTR